MSALDASELFPVVGAMLAGVLAGVVAWKLRLLPSRGLRVASVAVATLLSLVALLVAGALVFFDVTYTRRLPPLTAPDGRHVAITSYTVNTGTGVDEAEVAIRMPWNPYAHRVYSGPAQYAPNSGTPEPEAHWLDSTHLEIRFHRYVAADGSASPASGEQGCAGSAAGITITCVENRVHPLGQPLP